MGSECLIGEVYIYITLVFQNLSDLGLWSQINAGYWQFLEEAAFMVKGLVDYLSKKAEKRAERQKEREEAERKTGGNPDGGLPALLRDKFTLLDEAARKHPYVLDVLTAVKKQWDTLVDCEYFINYGEDNIGTLQ